MATPVITNDAFTISIDLSGAQVAQTAAANAQAYASEAASSVTAAAADAVAAGLSQVAAAASQAAAALDQASAAASQAAASASQVSAATSALTLTTGLASFEKTWLGDQATDPTVDNQGNPLVVGARYLNITAVPPKIRVYVSTGWQDEDATSEAMSASATLSAAQAATSAGSAAASQAAASSSQTSAATSAAAALTSQTAAALSAAAAATSVSGVIGELSLTVAAGTTVLSAAQAANAIYKISGALTGNAILQIPAGVPPHNFVVQNGTTGAYTLTVNVASVVPSAPVLQGSSAVLFSDATGVYATSSTTGVQFAKPVILSTSQTLALTNLGTIGYITAAGVVTQLPPASTYPAGAGFALKNISGSTTVFALSGSDTCDIAMPYTAANNDSLYYTTDGVSVWHVAWYSNKSTPGYTTSVSAPKLLANTVDNGVDAIQAIGSISATGTGGILRMIGAVGSAAAQLVSSAFGLALAAVGTAPITFIVNAVESGRVSAAGRWLIGTTVDDGTHSLQVNGGVKSLTGGFTFPDGTTQVTANGVTAPTSTVYTVANGGFVAGATSVLTSGFTAPFAVPYRNGGKQTFGVHYTLNADGVTVNFTEPLGAQDLIEVLTGVVYSPSTVYVPNDQSFTPAAGATSVPYPHTVGFAWLFSNGHKLIPGVDYTDSAAGFAFIGFVADGSESYEVLNFNPVTTANMLPLSGGTLTGAVNGVTAPAGDVSTKLATTAAANALALAVAATISGKNRAINGACNIAQAPSIVCSAGIGGYGGPDMYVATNGASAGGQFTQSQGTIVYNGMTLNAVVQTVNAAVSSLTSANYWGGICQPIEGFNCYDLLGGPAALSFVFSTNVSGTYAVAVRDYAATHAFVTTFSATAGVPVLVPLQIPTIPTSLTTPNSAAGGMWLNVGSLNNATYQTPTLNAWQSGNYLTVAGLVNWGAAVGNYIALTDFQFESGLYASAFERRQYAQELSYCQRYYYVVSGSGDTRFGAGQAINATTGQFTVPIPAMRATPSFSSSAATTFQAVAADGTVAAATSIVYGASSSASAFIAATVSSGLVAGNATSLSANNTTASMQFSARL